MSLDGMSRVCKRAMHFLRQSHKFPDIATTQCNDIDQQDMQRRSMMRLVSRLEVERLRQSEYQLLHQRR